MKLEGYKNQAIIKSMLAMGFSEEYIAKGIANGDIKIEKSEDENEAAAGDHESETKQEKKINKLEDEAVDAEKKVKKDERDTAEDRDAEGIEKSIEAAIEKSMASIAPLLERMTSTVERMETKFDTLNSATPNFRSAGLENLSVVQKSLDIKKDDSGKYELNVISQRPAVAKVIEKAYESMPDDLQKSMQEDVLAFLTNPEAETVSQELAQYIYNKHNVKLCK